MKKIMHAVMLDCEHATRLMIKDEEGKINWLEKMQLWMHKLACEPCTEFEKQNQIMNTNLEHHYHSHVEEQKMPEDLKTKLKKVLNN